MNIVDGNADDGSCHPPCQTSYFDSRLVREDPRDEVYGLFIQFKIMVSVHESSYVINEFTLLTRVGGIIGVGKELFWILIVMFTVIKFFMNKLYEGRK